MECTRLSTNKHLMREAFEKNGDPSPRSILVEDVTDLSGITLQYPVIVKPLDRSGSRGITKLESAEGLREAIENAKEQGFEKKALVEEFASGQEYSVEFISWKGKHHFLAVTEKFTTGAPHFIETGHVEPARLSDEMCEQVKRVVSHALDSLQITMGASHSEIKIDQDGNIRLIEIGGRMGGDYIGSHLVEWSTGVDFLENVICVALGQDINIVSKHKPYAAAVRFVFGKDDLETLNVIQREHPEYLKVVDVSDDIEGNVADSSDRHGMYLMVAENREAFEQYLPKKGVE